MNNPMMALAQAIRSGRNPQQLLANMARQDPRIRQAMEMTKGKSSQQMRQIAENMARERGLDLNDVARQLGITIPSER
jgi:predicted DsbA family dithiol-disulfide isomerase